MAPADWVKCHSALRKGAKRALPRATRFVFLELCLEARGLGGALELRTDVGVAEALVDLLGGDPSEVRVALDQLCRVGMVQVDHRDNQTFLVIPSWDTWNRPDTSTERSKKHRQQPCNARNGDPVADATRRNADDRCNATDVNALEERRGEKKREEETAPAPSPVPVQPRDSSVQPAALKPTASEVRSELAKGEDIWPGVDLTETARRLGDDISDPMNRAKGEHVPIVREAVAYARTQKAAKPHATPETLLGMAAQKVGWVLGDYRAHKREKARDNPGKAQVDPDDVAKEIAEADKRQAAERAKRDAEPKADPKAMAALTAGALERFKRGAA